MKKILKPVSLFFLVFTLTFGGNFKGDIIFQGEKLVNSFENSNMVEYIPKEEDLKTWTRMYAFRLLSSENKPELLINQITQALGAYPGPYSQVLASNSVKEKNVHFIAFSVSDGNIYEYNVFRYIDVGDMVISLQLTKRYYVEDVNKEYQDVLEWTLKNMQNLKEDITYLFEEKSLLNIVDR